MLNVRFSDSRLALSCDARPVFAYGVRKGSFIRVENETRRAAQTIGAKFLRIEFTSDFSAIQYFDLDGDVITVEIEDPAP